MSIKNIVEKFEKKLYGSLSFFKLYAYPYKGVVRREVNLAKVCEDDTVLNIGCGALPFTAVYITKITGARVTAIDKDKKALGAAQKITKSLNLEDKITLWYGNAADQVPDNGYSKAFVALQVEPKKEVLNNVLKNSNPDVVVREPRERFKEIYDCLPQNFNVKGFTRHNLPTFDRSMLISKD